MASALFESMSKNSLTIILGVLIVVSGFLGVPSSWKTVIIAALGLGVIGVALALRKDITSGTLCLHLQEEKKTDSYAQNGMIIEHPAHEHESVHPTETSQGV